MQRKEIDVNALTHGELAAFMERYDAMFDTITDANNRLLEKLAACPGTTNEHIAILNNWSLFLISLNTAFFLEIEKLGSTVQ